MRRLKKTISLIAVIVLLCSVFSANVFAAKPDNPIENMTDLAKTHWSYPAVEKCMQEGILRGDSETTFAPDRNMTRAEFTQMVYNRYKDTDVMETVRDISFTDVGKDADGNDIWFKQAVTACANAEIINGVGDGLFDPEGLISRQDAILILMRVKMGKEGIEKVDVEKKLAELKDQGKVFSDVDKIDAYAKKAVIGSIGLVIDGNDDGTINPLGNIIRCEAAQMMYNYLFVYDVPGTETEETTSEVTGEEPVDPTEETTGEKPVDPVEPTKEVTEENPVDPVEPTPEFIDGDYYRVLSAPSMTKFNAGEWKEFKDPQYVEGTNSLKYSVVWDKDALYLAVRTGDKTVQTSANSADDSSKGKTDGFYMYLSGAGEELDASTITQTQHGARIWFQKTTGNAATFNKGISGGGAIRGTKVPANAIDKVTCFHDKDAAEGQIWTFKFPWKDFFGMTNEVKEKDYVGIDFVYQDGEGGKRHSYAMTVNFNCATLEDTLTKTNSGMGTLAGPLEYKTEDPKPEWSEGDYYRALTAPSMTKFNAGEWKEFKEAQNAEGTNGLKYSVLWDKDALYLAVRTGDKTVTTSNAGGDDSASGKTDGFYMYLSGAGEACDFSTITQTQHAARIWFQKTTGDTATFNKGISGGGAMKGSKVPANAMDKVTCFYDKDAAEGQIWTFKFPWKDFFGMTDEVNEKDNVGIDFVYQDNGGGTKTSYAMTSNFNCASLEDSLTRDNGGIGTLAGPFEYKPEAPVIDGERFVFLGDSITRGYGLDSPETERFSETFTKNSGIDGSVNYAVDGAIALNLLSKIRVPQVKKDIEKASHVSITIGGNDLMAVGTNLVCGALGLDPETTPIQDVIMPLLNASKREQVTEYVTNGAGKTELALAVANYKNTLRQIISEIHKTNPSCVIYIQTIYNPVYESTIASSAAGVLDLVTLKYNEAIKQIAAEDPKMNVNVIDIYSVFYARKSEKLTRINVFDIHPNKKGHDVISAEYLKLYNSQKK